MKRIWGRSGWTGSFSATLFLAAGLSLLPQLAAAQNIGADSASSPCASFSAMAEKYEAQAQASLKSMETPPAGMDPAQIARQVEKKAQESSFQSEMAGLSRQAYQKCLRDYISGASR